MVLASEGAASSEGAPQRACVSQIVQVLGVILIYVDAFDSPALLYGQGQDPRVWDGIKMKVKLERCVEWQAANVRGFVIYTSFTRRWFQGEAGRLEAPQSPCVPQRYCIAIALIQMQ